MKLSEREYDAVTDAYLALLNLPRQSKVRAELQGVLSRLRDTIAKATGQDPEEVQKNFEALSTTPVR